MKKTRGRGLPNGSLLVHLGFPHQALSLQQRSTALAAAGGTLAAPYASPIEEENQLIWWLDEHFLRVFMVVALYGFTMFHPRSSHLKLLPTFPTVLYHWKRFPFFFLQTSNNAGPPAARGEAKHGHPHGPSACIDPGQNMADPPKSDHFEQIVEPYGVSQSSSMAERTYWCGSRF